MKISYNWIKQFLDLDLPADKTSEILTDLGLEVEGVSVYHSIKGGLEGVIVGQVVECSKHPNADRLKITKVDVGRQELLQIVCGAPNVAKGQRVAVATVGATLYGNNNEPWTIQKSKIRGEVSQGMICSEDELGLGLSHNGIMVLDESYAIGSECADVFNVECDTVFEIGITPNRSDALGHHGVARDLRAALLQKDRRMIPIKMPPISDFRTNNISDDAVSVKVLREDLAPRYCGLTLSSITIKESPEWLKHRLLSIGINPKNNIVDITNYVMHELGQPLHAFDKEALEGNKIIVRTMPSNTKFVTLDGVERTLDQDDLMICDAEKPLCIAGVFGGLNSGVKDNTKSIFLESAYFDAVSVRKTAKRHGLNTDASFRFERGVDPEGVIFALKRAANLMVELSGAEIISEVTDVYPTHIQPHKLLLSINKVDELLGFSIEKSRIKSILESLDIKILSEDKNILKLEVPAYRVDVCRDVDVIEEILRVYGYNNVGRSASVSIPMSVEDTFLPHLLEQNVSKHLVSNGFFEVMTNSLTKIDYTHSTAFIDPKTNVNIINSLSTDLSVMRQHTLPSMMEVVVYNHNRKYNNLKLFEFGKTYHRKDGKFKEKRHLSLLMTGNNVEDSWQEETQLIDFFDIKGVVCNICEYLKYPDLTLENISNEFLEQGIVYSKENKPIVTLGSVHQDVLNYFSIKQEVLYADFDWDNILKFFNNQTIKVKELSKFPEIRRDLALLLDDDIEFSQIEIIACQNEKKILKSVSLFDVYQGNKLPQGKKSYGVKFIFQNTHKTLTDKEVDKIMKRFISLYEKCLGASLR